MAEHKRRQRGNEHAEDGDDQERDDASEGQAVEESGQVDSDEDASSSSKRKHAARYHSLMEVRLIRVAAELIDRRLALV